MVLLGRHPEAEKNFIELDEVLGGRAPAMADSAKIEVHRADCQRMHAAVSAGYGLGREAIAD
jgi:hypothetical protein